MRWIVRCSRALVAAAVLVLAFADSLPAQGVTTSSIAGMVTDSSGTPADGARVTAVHLPSGTTYAGITRADGRFTIPGMRV
ncbi:MAG TPA: carboxypeptidase-like regulatory domain-containing protein, partial [Gemmatimonadales bacterium]|nr:carboxypeptidase-like regulatory domain-containing protein [Gemmatimonadales bacterium]